MFRSEPTACQPDIVGAYDSLLDVINELTGCGAVGLLDNTAYFQNFISLTVCLLVIKVIKFASTDRECYCCSLHNTTSI